MSATQEYQHREAAQEPHAHHWKLNLHWFHSQPNDSGHAGNHQAPSHAAGKRLDFTKNVPMDIPYPPFVHVDGVPNFRDLGGYACAAPPSDSVGSAYHVRQDYAFRCSELSQITPQASLHMTEDRNIHIMFDFRSAREALSPRGRPAGVEVVSVPVFLKANLTLDLSIKQLQWATMPDDPPGAGFSQGYVDWYRQIALHGAKEAYRVVFEWIRDHADKPFVFHCSAGKDRTGVMSALILKLCGVDDATVAWEYALTVPGMGVWEAAVEQEMVGDSMLPIRKHGGMTLSEAHRVCGSREANMKKWLEIVLEGEFGGAERFLREHIHFSDEDVAKIKANLIRPGVATVTVVDVPGMERHPQT